MNTIVFDNSILVPANKIVSVHFDNDNAKRVVVWLEGGFIQGLICRTEEEAKNTFDSIEQAINNL